MINNGDFFEALNYDSWFLSVSHVEISFSFFCAYLHFVYDKVL